MTLSSDRCPLDSVPPQVSFTLPTISVGLASLDPYEIKFQMRPGGVLCMSRSCPRRGSRCYSIPRCCVV